ncbi:MAG: amidohydrolase [Gemmataceae bacterium]|nr:amidohydrolase [Gemmataceae bacterium]
MIWDVHCHLSSADGRTPGEKMLFLLRHADRVGIEKLVVFMGYPFLQDPTGEQLRLQNDQVLQALAHHHDRAFGFVYVSPKHLKASLEEIERCVKNGPMVGIKLWVARRCHLEDVEPILRRAAELKAVVYQHTWFKTTGNFPGESTPLDLVALAKSHPHLKILCGHTGGNWEKGIRAIRSSSNLIAETGGFDPVYGMVDMACRELSASRVVYGSDAPGRSFASQIAKVTGADIPEADKRRILKENLRALLAPILLSKGIKP